MFPPLTGGTLGRDIGDLIYERLAQLEVGGTPADSSAYAPGLARAWERVDSVTVRFRLRQGARWHDGLPVTARDVRFSFEAYADADLDAAARPFIERLAVSAPDDTTILIRFPEPDPEQWYDATWFVRVLPAHVWDSIPRARWADDTSTARLVGSGPFRLSAWTKGQSLTLERVGAGGGGDPVPALERVVWRFADDPDAALNLLLSHEADLIEAVGDSARVARVRADPEYTTISYPSAVYGFLGFNAETSPAGPPLSRSLRRALALAIDRETAARAVFGPDAAAPPGPMSRALWVYDSGITVAPFDREAAGRLLDSAGWTRSRPDRVRQQGGRPLTVDILVPGTSITRRNLAQVIQEMWRLVGVSATVTTVDFPVFQERLRTGRFQTFIGAWLDEPSPRGLAEQWTSEGVGRLNYVRYRNPAFDSLFRRAARFRGPVDQARAAWREAMDTLNADVPAVWLYTPTHVAAASRRLDGVSINPYSWLSELPSWRGGQ
ncbi:MAG TPA: peptide ABC transporter substrate-binding protein [Gemmatimonadales bacterium]|nr:peptide ABC transporter substrate-binding protein [Gemmatimonadales bacterium]